MNEAEKQAPHQELSLLDSMHAYLNVIQDSRSPHTTKAYRQALRFFQDVLVEHGLDLQGSPIDLSEDAIAWFVTLLQDYAPATEKLYLTAVVGYYEFLVSEGFAPLNLARIKQLLKRRTRRSGQRLPQFSREAIEAVLEYAQRLRSATYEDERDHLRNLRDRAFLLTLADTGLRVHEACNMRRGDLDWNDYQGQPQRLLQAIAERRHRQKTGQ